MRLVVDTNVVVSALLWGGVPRQLLDAIHQGRATAFTSSALVKELREVLARAKFAALIASFGKNPEALAESYIGIAQRRADQGKRRRLTRGCFHVQLKMNVRQTR